MLAKYGYTPKKGKQMNLISPLTLTFNLTPIIGDQCASLISSSQMLDEKSIRRRLCPRHLENYTQHVIKMHLYNFNQDLLSDVFEIFHSWCLNCLWVTVGHYVRQFSAQIQHNKQLFKYMNHVSELKVSFFFVFFKLQVQKS